MNFCYCSWQETQRPFRTSREQLRSVPKLFLVILNVSTPRCRREDREIPVILVKLRRVPALLWKLEKCSELTPGFLCTLGMSIKKNNTSFRCGRRRAATKRGVLQERGGEQSAAEPQALRSCCHKHP